VSLKFLFWKVRPHRILQNKHAAKKAFIDSCSSAAGLVNFLLSSPILFLSDITPPPVQLRTGYQGHLSSSSARLLVEETDFSSQKQVHLCNSDPQELHIQVMTPLHKIAKFVHNSDERFFIYRKYLESVQYFYKINNRFK
jgi:hypothetical protein